MMIWVLYGVVSIIATFSWLVIHEMSHVLMAMHVADVTEWKITPYPNRDEDGNWRFASSWYRFKEMPSAMRLAAISLAPRIPNLLAIAMLPATFFITGVWQILLLIFLEAGVIDLVVGSMGITKNSDLCVASRHMGLWHWELRIAGLSIAAAGIAMVIVALLIRGS
jgi:hypothetical protein